MAVNTPPIIHALDITPLDPDRLDWSRWVDAERMAAAARWMRREDRARSIGAGLLLAVALRRRHPDGPFPPRIETGPHGKPFLPEWPDVHFNLSHSGKWAVCATAGHPVGVDIEQVSRSREDVARRFFSPEENRFLSGLSPARWAEAFCEIWVLKESYIKTRGEGLFESMGQLHVELGPPARMLRSGQPDGVGIALCPFVDAEYRLGLAITRADPAGYSVEILDIARIRACLGAGIVE